MQESYPTPVCVGCGQEWPTIRQKVRWIKTVVVQDSRDFLLDRALACGCTELSECDCEDAYSENEGRLHIEEDGDGETHYDAQPDYVPVLNVVADWGYGEIDLDALDETFDLDTVTFETVCCGLDAASPQRLVKGKNGEELSFVGLEATPTKKKDQEEVAGFRPGDRVRVLGNSSHAGKEYRVSAKSGSTGKSLAQHYEEQGRILVGDTGEWHFLPKHLELLDRPGLIVFEEKQASEMDTILADLADLP